MRRKTIALIIWWCEGTKSRRDFRWKNAYLYPIEVTNSDDRIVKIFADFLRDDLKVPNSKLRGQIQIHEGDNQKKYEDHWCRAIGISKSQLNKTIVRARGNKPGKNKGTFKLRVYNKELYNKLSKMLQEKLKSVDRGVAQLA